MRLTIAVLASLLSACTSLVRSPENASTIPNSLWSGKAEREIRRADGVATRKESEVVLGICDGVLKAFGKDAGGRLVLRSTYSDVIRSHDSYLFYQVHAAPEQPGWVEIQTYSFVQLAHDSARVHWSRTVSNRNLKADDPERFFTIHSVAAFERIDSSCPDLSRP